MTAQHRHVEEDSLRHPAGRRSSKKNQIKKWWQVPPRHLSEWLEDNDPKDSTY